MVRYKVPMNTEILRLSGPNLKPYVDQLGSLRIAVFKDFPYLYEGSLDYERKYLSTYLKTPDSHVTLIFAENELVGATTAILAKHEEDAFRKPFADAGYDPNQVCYFGESILLPNFRGLGLGKLFMADRLAFAMKFPEIGWAAFCAVNREPDHPLRPNPYRPLDTFWLEQGFKPIPGLTTSYAWRDIDQNHETTKTLQYWLKNLNREN